MCNSIAAQLLGLALCECRRMKQQRAPHERLSALGLIHTHYHVAIDVDTVCKIFIRKHPRRMEAASLLF